ncbi:prephenate dehydratase domain-containing protein [Buchnera aphidicola (Kurisakia onigurumii)]|uniref:prephenate dehydratase domain-containing protein n=1 Tax=Buchnera aphidicola TaxID=9 RepID=UPI0031B6757E
MYEKYDINKFRNEIDYIDNQIIKLISKRMKIAKKIAKKKIYSKLEIKDFTREKKIFKKIQKNSIKYKLNILYIVNIFKIIIEYSKLIQKKIFFDIKNLSKKQYIAYLGPKGSYSYLATKEYIKKNKFKKMHKQDCINFQEVITKVEQEDTIFGILPIENKCSGYIQEICNLLFDKKIFIFDQIYIPINHCLLGNKNTKIQTIKEIYTHIQPFQQCKKFFNQFPKWKIRYVSSSSYGMKKIKNYPNTNIAVIGNEIYGKKYGLQIIKNNISNIIDNHTRFIIISKIENNIKIKLNFQTSIFFTINKDTSKLFKIFKEIKKNKIELQKIKVYPIKKNPVQDYFYLEMIHHKQSEKINIFLKKLEKNTIFMQYLGSYPII